MGFVFFVCVFFSLFLPLCSKGSLRKTKKLVFEMFVLMSSQAIFCSALGF